MRKPLYFTVFLVGDDGRRAQVAMQRYVEGARLEAVIANASKLFTRFVVLDENYIQHYASDERDASGAYLPAGSTR